MRAGLFLLHQSLNEEGLQEHGRTFRFFHGNWLQRFSNRLTAAPINSGHAVRYQ